MLIAATVVALASGCGAGSSEQQGAQRPAATAPSTSTPSSAGAPAHRGSGATKGAKTSTSSASTTTSGGPVVASPTPGTIKQVVPAKKSGPKVKAKNNLASLPGDVSVRLVKARPVTITPTGPGDTKGPGVAVELEITNSSDTRLSIDSAVVELTYGASDRPGELSPSANYTPFAGWLETGKSARATYLFRVPKSGQEAFSVMVAYVAGAPVATFVEGKS
ncbi:hypothetical protein [Janibacter sp. GXQ6167]|uniref:hypothetical protein n=1 Tax=Janibacter sp. GXQ6167 TaxID=3240791 RepID=UPI003524E16B